MGDFKKVENEHGAFFWQVESKNDPLPLKAGKYMVEFDGFLKDGTGYLKFGFDKDCKHELHEFKATKLFNVEIANGWVQPAFTGEAVGKLTIKPMGGK